MNPGFIDGNKRVGFAATYVFLRISGFAVNATVNTTLKFVRGKLESGTFSKAVLEARLRKHTRSSAT